MAHASRKRPASRAFAGKARIRIRPLRRGDYDAIVSVWRDAGLGFRSRGRDSRRSIEAQLRQNRGLYLGVFEEACLVGVVFATHDTPKGWINRLAVRRSHQRCGIGSQLVLRAERALAGRGIRLVAAHVDLPNGPSLGLFQKLGYDPYPVTYVRKKRWASA